MHFGNTGRWPLAKAKMKDWGKQKSMDLKGAGSYGDMGPVGILASVQRACLCGETRIFTS